MFGSPKPDRWGKEPMKIVSRFKDYYDHISHRFGSDPDCVYTRKPLGVHGDVHIELKWGGSREFFQDTLKRHSYRKRGGEWDVAADGSYFMFVVAAERVVTFVRGPGDYCEQLGPKHEKMLRHDWKISGPEYPI